MSKTWLVCTEAEANWSDLLGELLVFIPPPLDEDEDAKLELLTLAVVGEVVEP
tara:strand:+ start:328 stop:486 length:159 start_codon:yes stop_codon:yes gene_type:complete